MNGRGPLGVSDLGAHRPRPCDSGALSPPTKLAPDSATDLPLLPLPRGVRKGSCSTSCCLPVRPPSEERPMETLHPHCAGLDVRKDTVVACVRHQPPQGRPRPQTRTFLTLTSGLLELADWLAAEGVTHVAMEPAGVYWK